MAVDELALNAQRARARAERGGGPPVPPRLD